MDNNLPLQIKKFNDKLRVMNQANSKILTLNAEEARSLHAEIYDLMATISHLSKNSTVDDVVVINMDGGSFK
jgi:cytochrome c-type biogenesis protein CcmH/NrfF